MSCICILREGYLLDIKRWGHMRQFTEDTKITSWITLCDVCYSQILKICSASFTCKMLHQKLYNGQQKEVQPAITFHDRWLQTPTLTSTNNCAKCFQSISALVHLSIYFCVHFYLITGETWDAAAWWPSTFQQNTAREKMGEKVFSFKLALTALTFQKKEKALAWWNATGERRTNMQGFLLFKFMFYKNTKLSKRKKGMCFFFFRFYKEPHRKRKVKLSAAPSSWQDACDKIRCLPSPPSHVLKVLLRIQCLGSIIVPGMALMVWNVPQCSYTPSDTQTCQENHPNQVSFALKANGQLWPRLI